MPIYQCLVVPTEYNDRVEDAYRIWSDSEHYYGRIVWKGFDGVTIPNKKTEHPNTAKHKISFSPQSNTELIRGAGFEPRKGLTVIITRFRTGDTCDPDDCYIATIRGSPRRMVRKLQTVNEQLESMDNHTGPFPTIKGLGIMKRPDGTRPFRVERAPYISLIPGAGLIYIGRNREGLLIASLFSAFIVFALMSLSSDSGRSYTVLFTGIAIWFSSYFRTVMWLLEAGISTKVVPFSVREILTYISIPWIGVLMDLEFTGNLIPFILLIPMTILSAGTLIRVWQLQKHMTSHQRTEY